VTVVYIAGPWRGKTAWSIEQQIRHAEELAFRVAALGAMPLCPHTNTRFFHGELTEAFWLDGTIELMSRCDAVMLTDNWHLSEGTRAEVARAHQLNLPVFDSLEAFHVWLTRPEVKAHA
jgi:hypothetical protein